MKTLNRPLHRGARLRRKLKIPALILVAGCTPRGGVGPDNDNNQCEEQPDVPPASNGDWYRPEVTTSWQWQLQPDADGGINTEYEVDVYDIDLFEAPDEVIAALHAAGRRVICYLSAGSYEEFRSDAAQFDNADLGEPLEGFADERWLDIRSESVRGIMRERLDRAVERGCDCVEPDNVDGYANPTGFDLTCADQLEFNRWLANEAHERGLCVGLKNDLEQVLQLVPYFDFAFNEQCNEYEECALLTPFVEAGKPVFNAEYGAPYVNDSAVRAALCEDTSDLGLRTLVLPLDLNDAFRFTCDRD